ncbi:MAG: hypothetical protein HYT86_02425 [candidate division NC10 bacterium]|nr:hypothetical protein [candidate division NC10 bacterium]
MTGLLNRILVQAFKHLPWLGEAWARRYPFLRVAGIPWAPLRKPLAECRLALVTTAGVHLTNQPPFNMVEPEGDPTYRAFPVDTTRELLTITHDYYDHTAAERDLNVVLPLERVRELVGEGIVGGLTATCYSLMGHIDGRHVATLASRTAPEVAGRLMADGADVVLVAPA